VDEILGTVEYIGLKTTRLRSLGGEQIIFSNTDLLKSRIRNYKRMYERRVVFGFGVTYQTPLAKLEAIPSKVKEIITSQQKTRFDRAHFKEFGDSSLNFEIVYFVQDPDYNLYMDIQQAINLALFRYFEQERIDFAYPTRTLYLQRETGGIHG
jgi:small-conductance mechanosensitive channel